MSKHARNFSASGHGAMRVCGVLAARHATHGHRASRAHIGIAPAPSFAKVFRRVIRRHCTAPDNLSRLSRLRLKKSGQRKPNRYAVSRLSRLVPTVFNMNRTEKEAARRVWCAGRELNPRRKTGYMQRNRATQKGTPVAFRLRVIRTALFT